MISVGSDHVYVLYMCVDAHCDLLQSFLSNFQQADLRLLKYIISQTVLMTLYAPKSLSHSALYLKTIMKPRLQVDMQ